MKRKYITPHIEMIAITQTNLICESIQWGSAPANSSYEVLSRRPTMMQFDDDVEEKEDEEEWDWE